MATRGRGGKRTPKNPAPVSGPGALSRRTDGGPAQPVRPIPAEQQGDRQASVNLQRAAPLPVAAAPGGAGGGNQGAAPAPPMPDIFAPTERPHESITAGVEPLGRQAPDSTLAMLQVMFEQFPNEDLASLIGDMASRGRPGGR